MRAVIDAPEAAPVHVAVDLRRREGAVPEQLLDRAQVGAALEQVGREGMPEPVRVRDQAPERARVEPTAAGREEDRVGGAARQRGAAVTQVAGEAVSRLLAERYDALLAALAAHSHELLLEVDVREIEPDGLGAAQPGRVHELDQRTVP
jgi:hypothetical protein